MGQFYAVVGIAVPLQLFLASFNHIVPSHFARDEAIHLGLCAVVVHVQLHVVEETFPSRPAVRVVENYLIYQC